MNRPAASAPSGAPVWGRVGVRLGPVGTDLPSRILDRMGDDIVLATPLLPSGEPLTAEPGNVVVVTWTSPGGLWEQLSTVVTTTSVPSPRWTLRPRSVPTRIQRRAYVRERENALLVLVTPRGPVRAVLVDLSEGGIRCVTRDASLEERDHAETALPLEGGSVAVRGEVVRRRALSGGRWELGIRFVDLATADGDRIRRHVFTKQARGRNRGTQ